MELLVFGAGSLGSLLGGLLAREHTVTLVGRDPHMAKIRDAGLTITGMVDETVYPDAVTDPTGVSADIALVTVKSYDTETAAASLSESELDAVCSLQNGIGNEEAFVEVLSCPVLGGTSTYGAYLESPGTVRMTGSGAITIGSFSGGESIVDELVSAFTTADIVAESTVDIARMLWSKVAVNAAINPITALTGCRNGAVAEEPLADVATAAAIEAVEVARHQGLELDAGSISRTVMEVAEATAENRSSMLQDIHAGSRTEIDSINGAVVDRAGTIPVPINETLYSLIIALETERRQENR